MPPEVFDQWLMPFVIDPDYGWPFLSIKESIVHSIWEAIFQFKTLAFWDNMQWKKTHIVHPTDESFDAETMFRIKKLLFIHTRPEQTIFTPVENGAHRLLACAKFITIHNKLPLPVVGLSSNNKITIIDGHHRLSAYFYLKHFYNQHDTIKRAINFNIPIWVGR